jgi:hypothetical protein
MDPMVNLPAMQGIVEFEPKAPDQSTSPACWWSRAL